jgi:hypothetical protein
MKVAKLFNYLFGHLAPFAAAAPLGTRHHFLRIDEARLIAVAASNCALRKDAFRGGFRTSPAELIFAGWPLHNSVKG